MRIAIDIRSLTDEHFTGISIYTRHLVEALAKLAPQNEFLLFACGSAGSLARLPDFKATNLQTVKLYLPNKLLFSLLKLPGGPTLETFLPTKPDAWLFPKFNFFKTALPYFLTVHDLAFEIFPQFITQKERYYNWLIKPRMAAERATGCLAVSESTARDLQTRWQINPERIHLTPLGIDHSVFIPHEQPADKTYRATYDLNRPYLLALATQEPRKNLETIIEGYELFRKRGGRNLPLVLSGVEGWKTHSIKELLKQSRYKTDILSLGYVPEKHKAALYRGAMACLFTSFYEGFGLPALEAMACGRPVISSATSALPEIINEAGLLVDPFNVNDIASALHELLHEPEGTTLRQHLSNLAVSQAECFTWQRTAQNTLQALKS